MSDVVFSAIMPNISSTKYGVVRPTEKGGQPVRVDMYDNAIDARNNMNFWLEQGEQAYLVRAAWERYEY